MLWRLRRCICKPVHKRRNDCEEIQRLDCRYGLSRSTSIRLQSSKRELGQRDPETFTTTATRASSSSGLPGAIGDPLNTGEGQVYPQTNTGGEQHTINIGDQAKSLEQHPHTHWEEPTDLRDFPFNIRIWSQFASDCLWASSWLSNDHEEFKRDAMNRSSQHKFQTQSVQRRVQTLIERKDAHNMQVLQDWKTFRWPRITLLSDPAAKLVRMKVRAF